MTTALRPRTLVLFVGDLVFFTLALWLSLFLRTFELPTQALFMAHLVPFSLLFVAWVAVYFIAGLYESRLLHYARRQITSTLLYAQLVNTLIAALFFFFVPLFGIAPKTLLVIYSAVSFVLVLLWRVWAYPRLGQGTREVAVVVGQGQEIDALVAALRGAARSPVVISEVVTPGPNLAHDVRTALERRQPSFVIAHWQDPMVAGAFPGLVNYMSRGVRFVDAMGLYEEVFGRVPLSVLNEEWLGRNVSRYAHTLYDPLKRVIDIVVAVPAFVISLLFYPFIALAIKLQDGGAVIIAMPRVGEGGRVVTMHKFRTMTGNDAGNWGAGGTKLQVTRLGAFLRAARLDELPQLWDVIVGTFSLIGPRPEFPQAVAQYEELIPYYGVRHMVKPGLSGWAQLYGQHAHHGVGVEETRDKLAHDLYYLKHRSLMLDAAIVLKTVKKLLTRSGV